MAKAKSKQSPWTPNPYEGFRATTRVARDHIEIYLSMTGNEGTLEDVLVAKYLDNLRGRGLADMAFVFVQMMALVLNTGFPPEALEDLWRRVSQVGEKYRVVIPPDWACMTVAGLNISDYQILFAREDSEDVLVVEPDKSTLLGQLKDIVFEGGDNFVAQGSGGETPKIQHQPDRGKKKGRKG